MCIYIHIYTYIVREFEIDVYTLLYLKRITNKVLLCSTGNPAQCYVAAWMGGEFGGEWIHVCVCLSPFTVHLKLSHCLFQLCSNTKIKMYFLIVLNSQSGIINKGKQATFTQIAPWDFRGLQRCVSLPWLRLWPKAAGQLLTE